MDLQLNDKVAVVTGASRGIGLAITAALSAEGARVVAGARNPGDELGDLQGVSVLAVDLTTAQGPADLVGHAVEEHGGIDILVNNVGGIAAPRLEGFSVDDADWQTGFELNFFSAVRQSRRPAPPRRAPRLDRQRLLGQRHPPGSVGSRLRRGQGRDGQPLQDPLDGVRRRGVRVNAVSPGPVLTTLWTGDGQLADQLATAMGTDRNGAMQGMMNGLGGVPLGRFSEPAEVASLVAFLASDRAGNVTGANYVIDGGLIKDHLEPGSCMKQWRPRWSGPLDYAREQGFFELLRHEESTRRITLKETHEGRRINPDVTPDGEGLVSHAGSELLARSLTKPGLTRAASTRRVTTRQQLDLRPLIDQLRSRRPRFICPWAPWWATL